MHELDIPCSDCGADLVERIVSARDLPVSTTVHDPVRIAVCPECEARYYPKETLTALADSSPDSAKRGDS
jgi:hypothetical protein